MSRVIVTSCFLLLASPVFAQDPPPPIPQCEIANQVVKVGFDVDYPTVPGDCVQPNASGGTAKNNGFIMGLQAREVIYACTAGVYQMKVWSQAANRWVRTVWGGLHTGYYPGDNFAHTWLEPSCQPTSSADVIPLGDGYLRCHGWDGTGTIAGDLQPGSNNGVLFALPARNVHIIIKAKLYHLELLLAPFGYKEAVYHVDQCDFDPS